MRIYIVGIVASGKTTISKMLANHFMIPSFELDVIVHPVINGVRKKRTPDQQVAYIKEIDDQGPWLIEGTYRASSHILLDLADFIIFLDPPLALRKRRVFTRFMKQQLGLEACHYKSNIKMLKMMYKWTKDFESTRHDFEKMLVVYEDKLIVINERTSVKAFNKVLEKGVINEFISSTSTI